MRLVRLYISFFYRSLSAIQTGRLVENDKQYYLKPANCVQFVCMGKLYLQLDVLSAKAERGLQLEREREREREIHRFIPVQSRL